MWVKGGGAGGGWLQTRCEHPGNGRGDGGRPINTWDFAWTSGWVWVWNTLEHWLVLVKQVLLKDVWAAADILCIISCVLQTQHASFIQNTPAGTFTSSRYEHKPESRPDCSRPQSVRSGWFIGVWLWSNGLWKMGGSRADMKSGIPSVVCKMGGARTHPGVWWWDENMLWL